MKFKSVIIFFNVLMLLFLGVIYIMPLVILGKDLSLQFWHSGWFLAPLIIGALIFIDIYFGLNYRVYTLLEKEDWPALVQELENKVLQKSQYNSRLVKLLINSYLVLSDVQSVTGLEKKLAIAKKSLLDENALSFCSARILHKDFQGAIEFLEQRCSGEAKVKGGQAEWLRWYYGFAQLLSRRFEGAADAFVLLAKHGRESIPAGLSAYFLNETLSAFLPLRSGNLKEEASAAKERVKKSLPNRNNWDRELKRMDTEVYATVLQAYTGKAGDYLYRT
ncbi:MAG: hypothetical protein FWG07_01925 [Treponema sp.]|nr:hypothetical protein [Treponema sp.]